MPLFPLLLLAFMLVPIAEIAVIVRVGEALGSIQTIALLVADSVLGAILVRREGRLAWEKFRQALAAHRFPGDEVTQGALILVGGALLLTPGFLTDVAGLVVVLPPTRALISILVRRRFLPRSVRQSRGIFTRWQQERPGGPGQAGRQVLDVEVVSVEREEPPAPDERDERSEPDEPDDCDFELPER
ncbi:MAG: FxsA family protein [Nitriliruptorales bacterium]